jgi:glucose-6-phosphate 1-dehydrogenase
VDTDRWRGMPFLLRTGKRMTCSAQRVSLLLRPVDDGPIGALPGMDVISLSLAGNGSLDTGLVVKEPGPDLRLAEAVVSFDLRAIPGAAPLPPYSSPIHDVLVGDRSLFTYGTGPAAADALAGPGGWLVATPQSAAGASLGPPVGPSGSR